MDLGYASEQITLYDDQDQTHLVGGHTGKTQLILSTPFIDDAFSEELQKIDALLSDEEGEQFEASLVVANDSHLNPSLKHIRFLIDKEEEFGDWYGIRLQGEALQGEFTKSLMLISKDGALFYDEYPQDISSGFNHETLLRKITAAHTCYTGKGCH